MSPRERDEHAEATCMPPRSSTSSSSQTNFAVSGAFFRHQAIIGIAVNYFLPKFPPPNRRGVGSRVINPAEHDCVIAGRRKQLSSEKT